MSGRRLMVNIGDFLADTMHLSTEETGAFLMLAMAYHQKGRLPNDIPALGCIARVFDRRWSTKIWPRIAGLFEDKGESLSIPMLDKWIEDRARRISDIPPGAWQRLRRQVFERDNYTCTYCGTVELTQPDCDHVTPIIQGGMSTLENLTTSCRDCNARKGGRTLGEWLQ